MRLSAADYKVVTLLVDWNLIGVDANQGWKHGSMIDAEQCMPESDFEVIPVDGALVRRVAKALDSNNAKGKEYSHFTYPSDMHHSRPHSKYNAVPRFAHTCRSSGSVKHPTEGRDQSRADARDAVGSLNQEGVVHALDVEDACAFTER